jgi:catalase (peroxidase I)
VITSEDLVNPFHVWRFRRNIQYLLEIPEAIEQFSVADRLVMAALVSIKRCSQGRLLIPFVRGRKDAPRANLPNLLPDENDSFVTLAKSFKRMGLTPEDGHALVVGSHSMA